MIRIEQLDRARKNRRPLPEPEPMAPFARMTEDGLLHAYRAADPSAMYRTLPCSCGGTITAPNQDGPIVRAVQDHQAERRHELWRAAMESRP